MSRTKYSVSFPSKRAGAEITWPNTVLVFPDRDAHQPLQEAYLENPSSPVLLWSESASVPFSCEGETLTCTTGAPTQTGADADSGGGGGGASEQLLLGATITGAPITAGQRSAAVITPGVSAGTNVVQGTLPPWEYNAAAEFGIEIDPPTFSHGTLTVVYAEVDICSPDGSKRGAFGLDTPFDLTSGEQANVFFDDASESNGAGTDLSLGEDGVPVTAAGGVYAVGWVVQFEASEDFAV